MERSTICLTQRSRSGRHTAHPINVIGRNRRFSITSLSGTTRRSGMGWPRRARTCPRTYDRNLPTTSKAAVWGPAPPVLDCHCSSFTDLSRPRKRLMLLITSASCRMRICPSPRVIWSSLSAQAACTALPLDTGMYLSRES